MTDIHFAQQSQYKSPAANQQQITEDPTADKEKEKKL